jgi:hypothetical protein
MLIKRQGGIMSQSQRLTITFEKVAAARLERLSQGRSKSDVIREALALEEVFQKALGEGGTLIFKDATGKEREIVRA